VVGPKIRKLLSLTIPICEGFIDPSTVSPQYVRVTNQPMTNTSSTANITYQRRTKLNLMGTGYYTTTSNNMKLVHWPLMGWLLQLVQR